MNFEKVPNQAEAGKDKETENIEQNVLAVGEREYHTGDTVTVVRSDGTVENDWTLKMFGGKFAVVEKVDVNEAATLRKVLTVEDFSDQQTMNEKLDARGMEMGGRKPSPETIAQKLGIDTKGKSLQQINEEITKFTREKTGM